jgi:hypothetical protein
MRVILGVAVEIFFCLAVLAWGLVLSFLIFNIAQAQV